MAEPWFFLSADDQRETLEVAAAESGWPAYLLEKDIWVVCALSRGAGDKKGVAAGCLSRHTRLCKAQDRPSCPGGTWRRAAHLPPQCRHAVCPAAPQRPEPPGPAVARPRACSSPAADAPPAAAGWHGQPRWTMHGEDPRDRPVSKAQLNAFMVKVAADPGLKARVDAAADAAAVVVIAHDEGHSFSAATWSRHTRG